ncbi:MAG: hypothetical protein HY074_17080 [Deltaproteobacteria bacterium]|nr:hypothetical protein [Deltaproteobacteria bacterium]
MPVTRKSGSSRKTTKARRPAAAKRGAAKSKSRQHYSEVSGRKSAMQAKAGRTGVKRAKPKSKALHKMRSKSKSQITPATRELFSDLAKVGRQIKRRVKRAL